MHESNRRPADLGARLGALLIALTAAFALAACSDESGHDDQGASAIPESAEFNQADVDFATYMIPHHAQALSMVDLTRDRRLSRPVRQLAEDIMDAQAFEIETMVDWLSAWNQPIPATMRDHVNAHDDGSMDMDADMPGMMSAEDMAALEHASDAEFEDLWLETMIEHHEGAIQMAEDEQADGEYVPALDLAAAIASTQRSEIDLMEQLLDS
jgi:uncharacterized protein (DUF305 family)